MLQLTWTENALQDLEWWHKHDAKILKRIIQFCIGICKNPTQGIGNVERIERRFELL